MDVDEKLLYPGEPSSSSDEENLFDSKVTGQTTPATQELYASSEEDVHANNDTKGCPDVWSHHQDCKAGVTVLGVSSDEIDEEIHGTGGKDCPTSANTTTQGRRASLSFKEKCMLRKVTGKAVGPITRSQEKKLKQSTTPNANELPHKDAYSKGSTKIINDEYPVEAILGHAIKNDKIYYEVKWTGYPNKDASFVSSENLFCDELWADYLSKVLQEQTTDLVKDLKDFRNKSKGVAAADGFSQGFRGKKILRIGTCAGEKYCLVKFENQQIAEWINYMDVRRKQIELIVDYMEDNVLFPDLTKEITQELKSSK